MRRDCVTLPWVAKGHGSRTKSFHRVRPCKRRKTSNLFVLLGIACYVTVLFSNWYRIAFALLIAPYVLLLALHHNCVQSSWKKGPLRVAWLTRSNYFKPLLLEKRVFTILCKLLFYAQDSSLHNLSQVYLPAHNLLVGRAQ